MNQKPMISVIVPIYKVEKYLPDCIDSILNQSYDNFELILVDDGSPDGCPEICDMYAQRDSRVKVIHKKNGGVSSARNAGICAAQGTYIMFVDSDDTVDCEFFFRAIHGISCCSADIFISGLIMETWNKGAIVSRTEYRIQEDAVYSTKELFENLEVTYPLICICGPCCKLFVREKIEKANLRFDESMSLGEDTFFNLHYYELCDTVAFSSEMFYHYRRGNSDSLFSKSHKDTYEITTKVFGKMHDEMIFLGCSDASMERFRAMYANLLIGGIHSFFRAKGQFSLSEKMELIQKVSHHPMIQVSHCQKVDRKTDLILRLLRKNRSFAVWTIFQTWYALHFLMKKVKK